MKYFSFRLLLLLLFLPLMAWAERINETEARQRALTFLQKRGKSVPSRMKRVAKSRRAAQSAVGESDYYVFNIGSEEGFVIVSGDDRTAEILGYADRGGIDEERMPDALRYWLEGYAEQMEWLDNHKSYVPRRAAATRSAIAPLVQTNWDQGAPYNNNCPTTSDSEKTVTGCVATSMAQVMNYHQYPKGNTTAIPGYTTRTLKLGLDDLDATTLNWDAMSNTYTTGSTGASADAVALLMQYCGWALQMNYNVSSTGGSSAFNASIAEALKTYFDYDGGVTYVQRHHYTYQQWVDMVYNELADQRPVVLGGQSTGGGHSFVCDGYEADDYFHINWGWSGDSDGYFRLSALCPNEQGIGGSSTLDGFSYTQDGVIGIQPNVGNPAASYLSLEKMQFDATGTTATQTVTREDGSSAFTISSIYLTLCSYVLGTNSFDYALLLTDAGGSTVCTLYEADNQSMTFNTNKVVSLTNVSTPEGLTDGTYYIKAVSRINGAETWQECYDGSQQQFTAVVSDNILTVTAPIVSGSDALPSSVSFAVSGNQTKGYEQTITASVKGGNVDYYGNLVLRANGTAYMGKTVEIPARQTVDVTFTYIPTESGVNILGLYTAKSGGSLVGSTTTIAIAESDATNNLPLDFAVQIDNQTNEGLLYGNGLRATVTVTNASTDSTYVGQLNCSARQWTCTDDTWSWKSLGVTRYPLTVAKGGNTNINLVVDDLPSEGYYSFRLTYRRVTTSATLADAVHMGYDETEGRGTLAVTNGYSLGDAAGTVTIYPSSSTIDAGDACYADFRNLPSLDGVSVAPSSNPNCVYLLPSGATTPDGIANCNVVCDGTASRLTLNDGYNFYTPVAFTAVTTSYTRTFTLPAAGSSGWSTLLLPFAVSTVTVDDGSTDGRTATWFTSDGDENGSFWLREFTADDQGKVSFDYAQQFTANTPYIIAVPGDTWGTDWQMTERPVTFSGTNASIEATNVSSVTGNYFKFCGNTVASDLTDCYTLNAKGSKFVKQTSTNVDAFRAWFSPVSISSLTQPSLVIANADATGIIRMPDEPQLVDKNDEWFTVNGMKLSRKPVNKGIYIHQGRIVIIK